MKASPSNSLNSGHYLTKVPNMQKKQQVIETSIISFLFLSIFISKPLIYIGLILLLLSQIFIVIKDKAAAKKYPRSYLAILSIALFCIGIVSTLSFTDSINDVLVYFRKGAIFMLLPILYFQLSRNNNNQYASHALLVSLVVALGYSGIKLVNIGLENWNGQRIASFWDLGRWGELLGYSIAVLVPLVIQRVNTYREKILLGGTLFFAIVFLLISGSRGPILALLVSFTIYFIYRKPFHLIIITLLCSTLLYANKDLPQISAISARITSILDLSTNDSNNARLAMWQQGTEFSFSLLKDSPQSFLLGTGIVQFERKYTQFLSNQGTTSQLIERTNNQFSFKDLHNTYLDLSVKLGIIYAAVFIALLLSLFLSFYKQLDSGSPWAYSGTCLLLTYFINSMFYTSGLEYQTTIFFLIAALCHTHLNQDLTNRQKQCSKPVS